jgi:hypothetical protein
MVNWDGISVNKTALMGVISLAFERFLTKTIKFKMIIHQLRAKCERKGPLAHTEIFIS